MRSAREHLANSGARAAAHAAARANNGHTAVQPLMQQSTRAHNEHAYSTQLQHAREMERERESLKQSERAHESIFHEKVTPKLHESMHACVKANHLGPLGYLGPILGSSWAILGPSWVILGLQKW